MNYKLLLDTASLAGEIMLSSGAETYRVEDTMSHILRTSHCETIEPLAFMTGIVVTINDSAMEHPLTMVKTVYSRSTNLNNVIKVNDISRKYCAGVLTLEEAYERLQHVKEKQYGRKIYNLATIGVSMGFAMMFGGNFIDVCGAIIVGAVVAAIITAGKISGLNGILINILSGIGIAVSAMILPEIDMNTVIVSAMMPIVPGVAITNAIRDTIHGDYLSGSARMLEAFLTAASIAVGVGLGMMGGAILC